MPLAPAVIVGITSLALAVGSTAYSISEGRAAKKDTQKNNQLAAQKELIQSRRQRMEQLRQARIMRAQVEQRGTNQNVGGSSGVSGAVGSIKSQASSNMSFIEKLDVLGQGMLDAQASYNARQANAALGGQVAGLAMNISGAALSYNSRVKTPTAPTVA